MMHAFQGLRRGASLAADHARRSQLMHGLVLDSSNASRLAGSTKGQASAGSGHARFGTSISLHDALLEDDTPFVLDDDDSRSSARSEGRTLSLATRGWFQRARDAPDTLAIVTADITEPAATAPSRPEFIQQTESVSALLTLVEHLSGSLDHEDVSAAIVHVLEMTGADAQHDRYVDDQAIRALQLLHDMLQSPMATTASTAHTSRRIDNLRVPEVSELLQALSYARRDGEFVRLRNGLVADLLQHLLHGPASADKHDHHNSADALRTQAPLRSALPQDVERMADAVSRLAGCMESASSADSTSPHHHLQCALNVRVAFSALAATALRQLELCASSPATCGWDVESLSGLVTALARLDHYNEALMDAVAAAAVAPGLMSTAPPASLALLLSGFARLRHDSPDLFRHAALQMRSCMHKLRPKDLAVAINAFESRHVSGTRWRNKPEHEPESSLLPTATAATVAAVQQAASPTLAEYMINPSFFPAPAEPQSIIAAAAAVTAGGTGGSTDAPGSRRDDHSHGHNHGGDQWDVTASAPHSGYATASAGLAGVPQGLAVRPMLRMDTKIEPWDLLAGGARKMYLWHLLDVSAATG